MPDRLRDSQRSKVYEWEQSCIRRGIIFEDAMKISTYLDYLSELYGVEVPKLVVTTRKGHYSYYTESEHRITLRTNMLCERVVLHEFAHSVLRNTGAALIHGRLFSGLAGYLYAEHLGYSRGGLIQSLDLKQVDYSTAVLTNGLKSLIKI